MRTALKSENLIFDIENNMKDTMITKTINRVSNVIIAEMLSANVKISFDAPVNLWIGVSLGIYPKTFIRAHLRYTKYARTNVRASLTPQILERS